MCPFSIPVQYYRTSFSKTSHEEDGERLERELYIEHCSEALTGEEMIRLE
jgi:hypothetical protein